MTVRRLLRNLASSWAGYGATLLAGFFLAPLLVNRLGTAGYGVWTLVVSLTGYCGLLDLGLRSSVVRFVVRHVAQDDHAKVNTTLSSALAMLTSAGVVAFLVTLGIRGTFGHFAIDPALRPAAQAALLVTGLNISLILPLGIFSMILVSVERYDVMNAITIGGTLTRVALVVVVLKLGYGIFALALIGLTVSVVECGAMAICSKALFPPLRLRWRFVDLASCKEIFGFGLFRFVWIVATQVIFYTDSVVIGIFINASAITAYAIAGSLINYGRTIASLATDTLFPAATRLEVQKDIAGLRGLFVLGTQLGLFVGLSLCMGYIFFGKAFIGLWMGKQYESSAAILLILTIPQVVSMSQYMSAQVLLITNQHKRLACVALLEATVNLCLSIALVRRMGVMGVAWGTAIPHAITTGLIVPYFALRTVKMRPGDYLLRAYLRPVMCAVPVGFISYTMTHSARAPSWHVLTLDLFAQTALFGILGYSICLSRPQRAMAREAVWGVFRRDRGYRPESVSAADAAEAAKTK